MRIIRVILLFVLFDIVEIIVVFIFMYLNYLKFFLIFGINTCRPTRFYVCLSLYSECFVLRCLICSFEFHAKLQEKLFLLAIIFISFLKIFLLIYLLSCVPLILIINHVADQKKLSNVNYWTSYLSEDIPYYVFWCRLHASPNHFNRKWINSKVLWKSEPHY